MALGYEVFEDERDFQQEGITGHVSRFTKGDLQYPCLIITETEAKRLNLSTLEIAKNMFTIKDSTYDESFKDRLIYIYIRLLDNHLVSFNSVDSTKIGAFMDLFEGFDLSGWIYSNNELVHLEPDMVSVLVI